MKVFSCIEGCAECCGPVPIPLETWGKFKDKAREVSNIFKDEKEKDVCAFDEDMKCAFLVNKKCSIYENRPDICRKFGTGEEIPCPFVKLNGNKRSEAITKRIQRKQAKKFKEYMKKTEAFKWEQ